MAKRRILKYNQKVIDYVLSQMEEGRDLKSICDQYNSKLGESEPTLKQNTIHYWKRMHPDFKEKYDIAYDSMLQYLANDILWIARQPPPDTGDNTRDRAILEQRRQEIDSLKFVLAKLNANHFKQQMEITHSGLPNIILTSYAVPDIAEEESKEDIH